MKLTVQLILLSLPILANAQLERTWVAVESRQVSTDFISPLDGTIFDFSSSELIVRSTFSDSTLIHNYRLDNNRIILNDSTSALIKHLSIDSLLLEFDEWMLTVFYPLNELPTIPELSNETLLNNTWTLDFGDYYENWNFTDIGWEMFPSDVSKVAVQREGDTEKWNVTKFKNFVLLTLTKGQFDNFIYQVLGSENDTARLRPINKWLIEDIDLIKTPSLPSDQLLTIKENLSTRIWKTTEIIESRSSSEAFIESMGDEIDSTDLELFNFTGSYAAWLDTLLISEQQFIDKMISYQFEVSGNYCILLEGEEYSCGTWELLNDGRTIKLDKGTGIEDYIEIVDVTRDQLIISNCNNFSIELGSNDYNVIYYTVKLE